MLDTQVKASRSLFVSLIFWLGVQGKAGRLNIKQSSLIIIFFFHQGMVLEDVRAQTFPRIDFFKHDTQEGNDKLLPKRQQKKWGSPTSFWREHASKNALNLKYRASSVDKSTVSVSPKYCNWIFELKCSLPNIV